MYALTVIRVCKSLWNKSFLLPWRGKFLGISIPWSQFPEQVSFDAWFKIRLLDFGTKQQSLKKVRAKCCQRVVWHDERSFIPEFEPCQSMRYELSP